MNAESSEQPKHHPARFCINNPRNLEERKFLFDQSFECRDCLSNCTRCFETRFLELELWQWIGVILLVLVAYIASWILAWLIRAAVQPIVEKTRSDVDDEIIAALMSPLRFALMLGVFAVMRATLLLAKPVQEFLDKLLTGLAVVAAAWVALRLVDVFAAVIDNRLKKQDKRAVASIVPLGRRAAKVFLIAIAAVAMLQNVGFNVTGLIAGLGVGGLAVALAAQSTIENIFGGVSVISDQTVRVGDFCKFGNGETGTVEEREARAGRRSQRAVLPHGEQPRVVELEPDGRHGAASPPAGAGSAAGPARCGCPEPAAPAGAGAGEGGTSARC